MIRFVKNDGGRADYGFVGKTGDCAVRAIAIATGRPYSRVYAELSRINATMPRTQARSNTVGLHSAAHGIYTQSVLFKRYMTDLRFNWVPTMGIGTGCRVRLREDELPKGRLVVRVSKHIAAVIDGVLHDTHNCSRNGTRCVYGYWRLER